MAKRTIYTHHVTINRKTWATPDNTIMDAFLYDAESKMMCCLGFYCNQAFVVPKRQMRDLGSPEGLRKLLDNTLRENDYPGVQPRKWHERAIDINDSTDLDARHRESRLKTLFKRHKVKLTFTGEYRKHKYAGKYDARNDYW